MRARTEDGRDRGQSSLEYVGLVVLVVTVVVAVVSFGLGRKIADGIDAALCRIVHTGEAKACAPAPTATSAATQDGLSPLERATRGKYVALGDSFASGEGGGPFVSGTDVDNAWTDWLDENFWWPGRVRHNVCHRSPVAYTRRVSQKFDFAGGFASYACSGATIEDLLPGNQEGPATDHANEGELPQLKHLDKNTSLVTLSIGGNDVGFANVMTSCVLRGVARFLPSCREAKARVRERITAMRDDLVDLYNEIQRRAPNARVLVVGYPRLFPENPSEVGAAFGVGDMDEPIRPDDQRWLNRMTRILDRTIEQAAAQAGVEFVGVYDVLDGHEISTRNPWVHDLDFELEAGMPIDMASFHPDRRGQAAIARRVERQIRNGE